MSFQFWRRWLLVVTGGVIVYAVGLMTLPGLVHHLFNDLFFASAESIRAMGEGRETGYFVTFVYGVLGAVVIGWMVSLMLTIAGSFQPQQRSAWNAVAGSVTLWWLLDSGFSLVIGAVSHALFNTLFFALFAIPLLATYRQFYDLRR